MLLFKGKCLLALLFCISVCCSADWLTYAHDAQRSGFNPSGRQLSPENASKLRLRWQVQLDNTPLALSALTAPVVADDVATNNGPKTLVFVAGSSNTFFAVDADTGKVVWDRTFASFAAPKEKAFFLCPNTPNATPVIDKEHGIIYTIDATGRLYGLDLATGDVKFGPFAFIPPFAKAWSLNLRDGIIYTTTSQSCGGDRSGVYSMRVSDPLRPQTHELLIRRGYGAGMWLRGGTVIGRDGTIYVSTGDGAFDPATGDYSNSFLAVTPDLSRVRDYFIPPDWKEISKLDLDLPSGGLVGFNFGNRELLAGGGKQGIVYLLDAANLGGSSHQHALYTSPVLANESRDFEERGIWGSPAAWTDASGRVWLYVPIWGPLAKTAPHVPVTHGETQHGSLIAFQVVTTAPGDTTLRPQWVSPDMDLPDAPVVANGVVFVLETGENPRQVHTEKTQFKSMEEWRNNLLTTAQRSVGTHSAKLVALDAKTGKLLYDSGNAMKSWVHFSGLAVSGGQIFAVDHESRLYCFGLRH